MVIYIDGPFYPDKNLSVKENQEKLCEKVYETMCQRAKNSDYQKNLFIKKE